MNPAIYAISDSKKTGYPAIANPKSVVPPSAAIVVKIKQHCCTKSDVGV